MAKAKKQVEVVERVVKEDQEVYVLTLTKEEAEALASLTGAVAGWHDHGPKLTGGVYHALLGQDVSYDRYKVDGYIAFKEL